MVVLGNFIIWTSFKMNAAAIMLKIKSTAKMITIIVFFMVLAGSELPVQYLKVDLYNIYNLLIYINSRGLSKETESNSEY
jgi:hypothetical protein